jgi:glutamyl/glutaminyl-tRNA synthetase
MSFTTRIAPSPTGMFHLGTARTAYFNWLAARASGGSFILRIDDTDTARNSQDAVQVILDAMDWLGLDYDALYYQSARTALYREAADQLIAADRARVLDDGAVALNIPKLGPTWHDTLVGDIPITKDVRDKMDPLILLRRDGGGPTYHFASIYDDYMTGVNWIIRGHDHQTNTPKQIAIWNAGFSGDFPQASHIGLIFKDGKKLSKRDNAASLLWYRDQGYHPDAVLSFLLRLGWSPNDGKTPRVITRERAIEMFLKDGKMRPASRVNYDGQLLSNIQRNYEAILKIPSDQWVHKRNTDG